VNEMLEGGRTPFHLDRVPSRVVLGRHNSVDESPHPYGNIRADEEEHPWVGEFRIRTKGEEWAMILV
jgi:hypothetical protein